MNSEAPENIKVFTHNEISSSYSKEGLKAGEILRNILESDPNISTPVAAIQALLEIIRLSKATTMSEFMETLKLATNALKESTSHPISVNAGCDLFIRFVTATLHETPFESCKETLLKSGNLVVQKASTQKQKIVHYAQDFIKDGTVVLIHSYSRVVMSILELTAKQNKRFEVFCTEARPSSSGYKIKEYLDKLGIPCQLILDSAVGYTIEKVDMVLVGAEGIVENGGLINSIGTYQISIIAKSRKVPFYCAAESFKFVRLFPLNQYDLPNCNGLDQAKPPQSDLLSTNRFSSVDYTPPEYITLLITDLGVLTPSGVSDELIKIYY